MTRMVVRPDDDVAQILTVCTGNIARSPFAEVLLQSAATRFLGPDAPVWVRSAGVHAVVGEPAVSEVRRIGNGLGLDLSAHRGAQVDADVVLDTDLVLTMTEDQRQRVLRLAPAAAGRVFTLVEFARLLTAITPFATSGTPRDHIRTLVRVAHGTRPYAAAAADVEDVRDPYRRGDEVYLEVTERILALVSAVAVALFDDNWNANP